MPLSASVANSVIEVALSKVQRNIGRIRRHVGAGVEIMYVAKANGYGFGLIKPAMFMYQECGIKYFATGMISEAIKLRDAGLNAYLLVLGGIPDSAISACVNYDLAVAVFDVGTVVKLATEARKMGRQVRCHIKIETGLNRLGAKPGDELASLITAIKSAPEIVVDGIFTHLGNSYSLDKSYTKVQLQKFDAAIAQVHQAGIFPKLIHAAASGGCVNSPEAHYNMVRLAALIYGLDISESEQNRLKLENCIRWTSFVTNVRVIDQGESVSYYHWFVAQKPTQIAVLGFGIGDGYVRTLAMKNTCNNADVLIHGKRARLIDINVDQAFADVTDIRDVKIGDEVTLLGCDGEEEITSIELGAVAGTSSGHVCCSITGRPFRKYIYD